jgi:hypothetical protein
MRPGTRTALLLFILFSLSLGSRQYEPMRVCNYTIHKFDWYPLSGRQYNLGVWEGAIVPSKI